MPLPRRLFPGDEELGKKDDDHKPGMKSPLGIQWQRRPIPNTPHPRNIKKLAFGILLVIGLYYFFKNMPTDLVNPRPRPHYDHNSGQSYPAAPPRPPPPVSQGSAAKPQHQETSEGSQHYFSGPIKFYKLAVTMHAASKMGGSEMINRNVLFAAASLRSASILLPIACEMAIRERNSVHFAFMGRDDISMEKLKAINGVSEECKIMYHDARPDFSVHSTEFRMEVSCAAGFNHINTFIHPQATFVDASGEEEMFLLKGLGDKASSLGRTVIELPDKAEQQLMWTTLLDSASLSAWNKVGIDVLVHAPKSSSGSLIRLLESLKKADFFSSAPPRLTIELPHKVDEPTRQYLENFKWPPNSDPNSGSLLALHHRIPQHGLTAEENSIRFLETFWPANPSASHVLVLSPQAELSPLFFHYLKYTLLEYKYASAGDVHQNLLGISLDLPSTYLNDSAAFTAPLLNGSTGATPFLWQAPSSNAALYFGDKWVEIHDFVAQLLSSQHKLPTPATLNEKLVSKTYPSWLEHIVKLARARGYWTLYPNFDNADVISKLNNELYVPPEEYSEPEEKPNYGELTADPAHHLPPKYEDTKLAKHSLLGILPFDGNLPKMSEMPLLSWDGEKATMDEIARQAATYSQTFRHEIGGCEISTPERPKAGLGAGNLFCSADPDVKV